MNCDKLASALARYEEMLDRYRDADAMSALPEILRDAVSEALLQRMEYTQETAWKTVKRYLVHVEGYGGDMGPKTVCRLAGRLGLLDAERWLFYLELRQKLSHDYSGEKSKDALAYAEQFAEDAQCLATRLKHRIDEREGSGSLGEAPAETGGRAISAKPGKSLEGPAR